MLCRRKFYRIYFVAENLSIASARLRKVILFVFAFSAELQRLTTTVFAIAPSLFLREHAIISLRNITYSLLRDPSRCGIWNLRQQHKEEAHYCCWHSCKPGQALFHVVLKWKFASSYFSTRNFKNGFSAFYWHNCFPSLLQLSNFNPTQWPWLWVVPWQEFSTY